MGNGVYKINPENESLQSNSTTIYSDTEGKDKQILTKRNNININYGSVPESFIRRDSQTFFNGFGKTDSFNYQKIKDD